VHDRVAIGDLVSRVTRRSADAFETAATIGAEQIAVEPIASDLVHPSPASMSGTHESSYTR
jgi:hypothetical protein